MGLRGHCACERSGFRPQKFSAPVRLGPVEAFLRSKGWQNPSPLAGSASGPCPLAQVGLTLVPFATSPPHCGGRSRIQSTRHSLCLHDSAAE